VPLNINKPSMVANNIYLFIKKFNLYLRANGLETKPDGLKVAVLFSIIGDYAYELVELLNLTKTDSTPLTTTRLFETIINYYEPKKNVIVEQFKRCQEKGEKGLLTNF